MADTSLRPRPTFGTFLQSDNSTKDGLSYYEYQRLLRSKKVALLQEKKERSYEPGYKKPTGTSTGPVSRKIFQLKSKDPATFKKGTFHSDLGLEGKEELMTKSKTSMSPLHKMLSVVSIDKPVNREEPEGGTQTQSDRLPRINTKVRMVKSATARDNQLSSPSHVVDISERPKTVGLCGVRNLHAKKDEACNQGVQTEAVIDVKPQVRAPHKRAYTDGSAQLVDLEDPGQLERDELVRAYTWRTSSQRATDEVGWNERVPSPPVPPPASTVEQFPDPVSMRLTFRRYHSEPAEWQSCGTEWDFIQSRPGNFVKGPQGMNYSSSSHKTQQLPGYYGHIPDNWLLDVPTSNTKPTFLVRSLKPRPTNISRKANIPGYTGCVHWTKVAPAHSDMPLPEPTTSARTHRNIPLEEERSPFVRTGVFSKMVKTVSPHNPYN